MENHPRRRRSDILTECPSLNCPFKTQLISMEPEVKELKEKVAFLLKWQQGAIARFATLETKSAIFCGLGTIVGAAVVKFFFTRH